MCIRIPPRAAALQGGMGGGAATHECEEGPRAWKCTSWSRTRAAAAAAATARAPDGLGGEGGGETSRGPRLSS